MSVPWAHPSAEYGHICRGEPIISVSESEKCGSFGFGGTLQALVGPLPRCNGIMFQDQRSNLSTRSISHAKSH